MLLFQKKDNHETVDSGYFYCPSCEEQREYDQKELRPTISLYGLKLKQFPPSNEYILCSHCQHKFPLHLLEEQPSAEVDTFGVKYRDVLTAVAGLFSQAGSWSGNNKMTYMLNTTWLYGKEEEPALKGTFSNTPEIELQNHIRSINQDLQPAGRRMLLAFCRDLHEINSTPKTEALLNVVKQELENNN